MLPCHCQVPFSSLIRGSGHVIGEILLRKGDKRILAILSPCLPVESGSSLVCALSALSVTPVRTWNLRTEMRTVIEFGFYHFRPTAG